MTRLLGFSFVATVLAFGGAGAQAAPYMRALTVPPDSVGTCLPTAPPKTGPVSGMHVHHISIKTRYPDGDRDIMVLADERGRVRRYADRAFVMIAGRTNASAFVIADFDSAGRVGGFTWDDTLTMHALPLGELQDTAALRRRAERAAAHGNHRAITPAERAKATTVAQWLLRRCPG